MVKKGSKPDDGGGPKEKSGKRFRSQFWSANGKKAGNEQDEQPKRPESSVSRQFLPKKQQGVSEAWSKQTQENREQQNQPFNYTPFKSNPPSRPTSATGFRGVTPVIGETILQPQTLQSQQQLGVGGVPQHTQAQFKPQYIPQLNSNLYQMYGIATDPKEIHPQGQSTPKMAIHHDIGRPQNREQVVPSNGQYRPGSAISPSAVPRPTSRANSDVGIGVVGCGLGSRYQSYCTLPRPEQIEVEQNSIYNSEIAQMAQQINVLYGSYNTKPIGDMQPIYMQQNQMPVNRPASQMLAGAPGMASDFINAQPTSAYDAEPASLSPPDTEEDILKPAKDIVYFDALSLLSVFQVLCSIVIFTCGVLRLIWHAKWAIGIELTFAVFVFITGALGIYASSKRSHIAAVVTFVMSAFASVLALIPLVLGLFPTIPLTFPSADSELFINVDESPIVDYLLSFACAVELIISLITSIYGCQAVGMTMQHVEKLRLNADLNAAFESSSTSLPKSTDTSREKKAPLH